MATGSLPVRGTITSYPASRVLRGDPERRSDPVRAWPGRGIVEINTNAISVTEGWGTTNGCSSETALARLNLYRTAVDGLCFFVEETSPGVTETGPEAWQEALAFAAERDLSIPEHWMTVGYRVSNRQDIVDTRYHFDGLELGGMAPGRTVWTKEAVMSDPDKFVVVNDLNAWAGLMSELFQDGLRGVLPERLKNNSVPHPLAAITGVALEADAVGRASKESRKRALRELVADGVIAADDLETYIASVDDVAPPPTIEDYYQSLVAKTISYNMFRVSVDYLLAFIVTVNTAVSGYITAAIVATHSVAQVLNDMAWDSYIAGQRRDGSELIEFLYIGRAGGAVS